MRDHIFFFLNGQPVQVSGRATFEMLAPFLRQKRSLTGTKIACAHGACGSCSVLVGRPNGESFTYQPINSCIFPVFNCDGAHIITVEGLNGPSYVSGQDEGVLSAVQKAIVECHGAQCGFCTPGVVITLTAFNERSGADNAEKDVQSALEGNLCRCTGYSAILEAGHSLESTGPSLDELYPPAPLLQKLGEKVSQTAEVSVAADAIEGDQQLFAPRSLSEAAQWKADHPEAVVVAGGTEVGVAMSVKGLAPREILSLSGVPDLDQITVENNTLILSGRATWTKIKEEVGDIAPQFAAFLQRWGSPQLRNAGTIAGSIVRASHHADSLPFLLVSEAKLELVGPAGTRFVDIADFLEADPHLHPDELLHRVHVPLLTADQHLWLYKVSKRRTFDRSIVSAAILFKTSNNVIEEIKVAFGGASPTPLRLPQTEAFLQGKPLETAIWRAAATIALTEISPFSDAIAEREYRVQLVANLLRKFGSELSNS